MIIDTHVRIGPSFDGKGRLIEDYIIEMEKNGIDRAVLCGNLPVTYRTEEGNAYVAGVIKRYPDTFYGAWRADPWRWDEQKEQADGALDADGFIFLYLNPWEDHFRCNDAVALSIYEYALQKNVPVMIETGYPFVSHVSQVGEIAEAYPRLKLICTDAAQIDLSGFTLADVGYMLGLHDNMYIGTAAAVGAEWLVNQIENNAPGRVLFQTGYPTFDPYMEKYRIDFSYTDNSHREEVFSRNLLRMLE